MNTLPNRRLTGALRIAFIVGFVSLLQASTPGSGTITTPTDDNLGTKQTLTFAAGPFAAGSAAGTQTTATVAICTQAVTPPAPCDVFAVNFNLPADYWQTRRGTLAATVKWADAPDGNARAQAPKHSGRVMRAPARCTYCAAMSSCESAWEA